MGQILHGRATTTHAIRTAIQRSKAPLKDLAMQYGLNQKTVAKWRRRSFVHDVPMGPKAPRSTEWVPGALFDLTAAVVSVVAIRRVCDVHQFKHRVGW
jgi:hypothetical protein